MLTMRRFRFVSLAVVALLVCLTTCVRSEEDLSAEDAAATEATTGETEILEMEDMNIPEDERALLRAAMAGLSDGGSGGMYLDDQPMVPLTPAGQRLFETKDITKKQLDSFWMNGHIILRNFIERDIIEEFRPKVQKVIEEHKAEHHKLALSRGKEGDDLVEQFDRVHNLWEKDETIKEFTLSKRLAKLAADLLQVDTVRLYQDQSFFKRAEHAETMWHDDVVSCPFDGKFLTIWIPMHNISKKMGTMEFAVTSHRNQAYLQLPPPVRFDDMTIRETFKTHTYGAMNAGDITVHHGYTLHGAPPNMDKHGRVREAVAVQFYADGATIRDKDALRKLDPSDTSTTSRWLFKFGPGDEAICPELPLAYVRGASGPEEDRPYSLLIDNMARFNGAAPPTTAKNAKQAKEAAEKAEAILRAGADDTTEAGEASASETASSTSSDQTKPALDTLLDTLSEL